MARTGWWCRAGTGPGLETLERVFRRAKDQDGRRWSQRTSKRSNSNNPSQTRPTLLSPRMQSWAVMIH